MTPIAQESATTGNKPADQEGQPVAVDNRADSLRALLFLGDLGLYAINIALLIACFSSIPTQTKELDQRGPHALSPAAITADRSCLAYSAQLTAASPSLCTKLSRQPAYPISYLPGQGSLHFLSEELLTTGAPLYPSGTLPKSAFRASPAPRGHRPPSGGKFELLPPPSGKMVFSGLLSVS